MASTLRTHELTKSYGGRTVVRGVSLEVNSGEVVGLLGPNGSGKSTALRLMLGFLRPTSGRAMIGGFDCWTNSVETRKRVEIGRAHV